MNRLLQTMLIGASIASLSAVSAFAQERGDRRADPKPRATQSEIGKEAASNPEVVAVAPNSRLAALILRDLTIQRDFNVASVRRLSAGVYCIRPTAGAGIDPRTNIVVLTPEYFFSLYNEVKVQWASRGSGCNSNEIGVYTMADVNLDGIYTFSNAVSFSIVVP
jgi:hypothetical protein